MTIKYPGLNPKLFFYPNVQICLEWRMLGIGGVRTNLPVYANMGQQALFMLFPFWWDLRLISLINWLVRIVLLIIWFSFLTFSCWKNNLLLIDFQFHSPSLSCLYTCVMTFTSQDVQGWISLELWLYTHHCSDW